MNELPILLLRGAAGGCLVVVFALISEVVKPKAFAGLFATAPSVAIASLAITVITESATKAHEASIGMVLGGVGMAASCVIAVGAIPRLKAVWGSVAAVVGWGAVALGLYWSVFVGAR